MFAYIKGTLTHKEPTHAVIDVNGVGYEIRIPVSIYSELHLQQVCTLYTYLHVREDAQLLFGFLSEEDKRFFLLLISVSGIGANTALVMLSSLSSTEIKRAIVEENDKLIATIKGIGAKTAQRVILELKDKVKKEELVGRTEDKKTDWLAPKVDKEIYEEALLALMALGIVRSVAEKSLTAALKKYGSEGITVEDLIRNALRAN